MKATQVKDGWKICTKCAKNKEVGEFYGRGFSKKGKMKVAPECKDCTRAIATKNRIKDIEKYRANLRVYYSKNRDKAWGKRIEYKYGISVDLYVHLLKEQKGVCAACWNPETSVVQETGLVRKLAVDHDHSCCNGDRACGKCVRGLLCSKCNRAIGLANDNPGIVDRWALYLRRHEAARGSPPPPPRGV